MGGTRCTYRNCTMRSNGVVHMFHYPVFDKVRCHQWLTNAQRLEFLDLKVSQLKNRVVCQHHFTPSNFMNYKMDKLRFDAVPTENGPFCDSTDWPEEEIAKAMPIGPEDIENDRLSLKEKIATFSVKYGDFLINSEMEPLKLHHFECKDDRTKPKIEPKPQLFPASHSSICIEIPPLNKTNFKKPSPVSDLPRRSRIKIISEKKIDTPLTVKGKLEPITPNLLLRLPTKKELIPGENQNIVDNIENMEVLIHNPEVKSVDVNTSQIMFFPQMSNIPQNMQIDQNTFCLPPSQNDPSNTLIDIVIPPSIPNSFPSNDLEPKKNDTLGVIKTPTKSSNIKTKNRSSTQTNILKSKISPERIAAIEEKRKFNKKLRDMIEFCLDDNPEVKKPEKHPEKAFETKKQNKKSPENPHKHLATLEDIQNEIHSHKDTSTPSAIPQWNMLTLEARLKNMEANLLRKIDQNAERIVELKSTIHTESALVSKRSISTQTKDDEETQKKLLYQEISQFLSPDVNSLIYEELFLNKYSSTSKNMIEEYSPESKRIKLRRGR